MAVNLNTLMEFDHPIRILADGVIAHAPDSLYAPTLLDEELNSADWELLDGYSSQSGYAGPVMHNSEYIGGKLAAALLTTPGIYVSIVAHWTAEHEDDGDVAEGWAVARYVGDKH